MPRINLLPWRDAERKRKRQEFLVGIGGAVVIALLLGLLAKFQLQSSIDHQNERNQIIKDEISAVDKQITKILSLDAQKQRLLARMDVIEQLQRSRPGIVHLFDQIVRTIPDGVYFTSIKQTGGRVQINGIAQSSTRVSALMRNIESSEWMADPALEKVETKGSSDAGAEFTMYANQTGLVAEEPATTRKGAQRGKRAGSGFMNDFLEQLRNIDPNDPGRWPLAIRLGAVALVLVLASGLAVYYLAWSSERPVLEAARAEEQQLLTTLEQKAKKAANLEAYEAQLKEMEQSFGAMLRQLPNKTEVPSLLVDISQKGLEAGLEQKLFQPSSPVQHDFYAEVPIKIRLTGNFHAIGNFVSGIASLPRIVTLHDINITAPQAKQVGTDNLQLEVTAKTYRYLEDDEQSAKAPQDAKKPG